MLILFGCGGRIWTYDLQVMSLTSYRAAPPRAKFATSMLRWQTAIKQSWCESNKVSKKYMWLEDQATTYSPVP